MFSKTDAERLAAGLEMREAHRALLDHWLSLWPGDALPSRALLSPAKLKYYLPSLLLFDTVPDRSVTIRLAGTRILRTLKTELTGQDWIALAPKSYRAERLRLFSRMARGAFGLGHRRIPLT
ncbi:MAG TPA: PAS domain-containing protein, partial [Rhizomicrobium sp.]